MAERRRSHRILGKPSPRASLLLIAFNQEETVGEALRSCLAQVSERLDIVCSDDASSDGTYAVLQRIAAEYSGPHVVTVRRNAVNLGIGGHYNELVDQTTTDLLITAAGDDISEPDRVARLLAAWDASGRRADLVSSHVADMAADGTLHGVLKVADLAAYRSVADWIAKRPRVIGAGHAFTRRMMRRFGPLDPMLRYEDQIMAFRAIASGGGVTVAAPLVRYRRGGHSGRREFKTAAEIAAWRHGRLAQEIAERRQLMDDAQVAGCGAAVAEALEGLRLRQCYMERLYAAATRHERWAALREAGPVPPVWRMRKWLQATFPKLRV
jgi:glycosyltransferase involved in cell wall biosynthesis